jgi:hypothetical protein
VDQVEDQEGGEEGKKSEISSSVQSYWEFGKSHVFIFIDTVVMDRIC